MKDLIDSIDRIGSGAVGTHVRLSFAAVFSLLLASTGVSLYNTNQLHESTKLVAKNVKIQHALNEILSTMKDVETGQRGYLLTGNKIFLEPYNQATPQIQFQIDRLRELLSIFPGQLTSLESLEKKISACLALTQDNIVLRNEKGMQAAQDFIATGQGKRAMDAIRSQVAEMTSHLSGSERILEIQSNRTFYFSLIAELLVALLGLGLVGMAFQIVRRELSAHYRTLLSLYEQRERLRVTLNSIGDAVIVTDEEGVIRLLNPIAGSLTGWHQDALGQKLSDVFRIISETTRQLSESPVDKVIREGAVVGLANHTLLIDRAGNEIAIDDSGAPIRDRQGNIDGVVLVFRDITSRRHTENALQISELRYRRVFETSREAILVLDGDTGDIIDANPFATEFTGFTRPELTDKQLWHLGLFENKESYQAALQQIFEQGLIHYVQLSLKTKVGKHAETECVAVAYQIEHKRYIQFSIHDITARIHAEESLNAARDRFRSVVDHVIHGIISIDESGLIESVNPAAENLFGYQAVEIVGQNFKMLMPNSLSSEQDYLANYLQGGEVKIIGIGREVVGLRKDNSTFPMELAVSTFPLGKRRLFTGIVQDITERKQLEENLRERVEQLREADRRKNEFLAMLAHELRNPLTPVQNAVHLLRKKGPQDADIQWAHDVIERQVQHMTRMVDDLLDVSRITRGMIELRKEPIDFAVAVSRALEMTQPFIDARQHRLIVSQPPDALRLVADLPRLSQILANLLNNAAKYTEVGGKIWLTIERQGSDVLVKVRDTGIGIPPQYLPHVFDLFSQEDSSLERTQGGLGIGLTLVRVLVKMHGGSIKAFSAGSGLGSEFVMRLPALDDPTPSAITPNLEKLSIFVTPRRILVVDDNVDGAKSLSILLRNDGHEVQTANDGLAALEIASKTPLDVVLLDIGMPHMSGLEVARRLRSELGLTDILLVAMTGYGQDADRMRSQEAGFNAHMIKPLDLDALKSILARSAEDGAAQVFAL